MLKKPPIVFSRHYGKSGWINLGENATELIECETGEKLLKEWKLFRYCNDPFMIQCLETACAKGKLMHNFCSCKNSLKYKCCCVLDFYDDQVVNLSDMQ